MTTATIEGSKLVIDEASLVAALQKAMTPAAKPAETPVSEMSANLSGFLPTMPEIRSALIGGYYATFTAKAVGKLLPVASHPLLSDLIARGVLGKWGHKLPGMSSEALHAMKVVLLFDAARALLPVVDIQINGVVAKLPSVGPATPFTVPTFGTLGSVSAMRNTPVSQQGAPVVNVRTYANL